MSFVELTAELICREPVVIEHRLTRPQLSECIALCQQSELECSSGKALSERLSAETSVFDCSAGRQIQKFVGPEIREVSLFRFERKAVVFSVLVVFSGDHIPGEVLDERYGFEEEIFAIPLRTEETCVGDIFYELLNAFGNGFIPAHISRVDTMCTVLPEIIAYKQIVGFVLRHHGIGEEQRLDRFQQRKCAECVKKLIRAYIHLDLGGACKCTELRIGMASPLLFPLTALSEVTSEHSVTTASYVVFSTEPVVGSDSETGDKVIVQYQVFIQVFDVAAEPVVHIVQVLRSGEGHFKVIVGAVE